MPRYKEYHPSNEEIMESLDRQVANFQRRIDELEATIANPPRREGSYYVPQKKRALELAIKNRDRVAHTRDLYRAHLEAEES